MRPIGEPDVKLEGSNVTILTVGATLYRALEAAKRLKAEFGISAEIIDARTLVPFSYEKLLASVKKTGFLLLVADAVSRGGFLNDIAANVTRMAFDDLDAPPIVIGARQLDRARVRIRQGIRAAGAVDDRCDPREFLPAEKLYAGI